MLVFGDEISFAVGSSFGDAFFFIEIVFGGAFISSCPFSCALSGVTVSGDVGLLAGDFRVPKL